MKAISLWQPLASAMILGVKKYETRSWTTNHRGQLLIHAAKKFPPAARNFAMIERTLGRIPARLPFGAIIGSVNLIDIKRVEDVVQNLPAIERLYGEYLPGWYVWLTDSFTAFNDPIPYRGQQGIFTVPDEVIQSATKQRI
jgi:hypothetical protein